MNYFHIAVAGTVKEGENKAVLSRVSSNLLVEAQLRINDCLTDGEECTLKFFAHKSSADEFWNSVAEENQTNINWLSDSLENQTPVERAVSVEELLTHADLLLLLWDETFSGTEGIMWDLIQKSKEKNIPCIWIDKKEPYTTYWTAMGYFQKYEKNFLKDYCNSVFYTEKDEQEEKQIPFISLGEKLYKKYLKKYRAENIPGTYEQDELLNKAHSIKGEGNEAVRDKLLAHFTEYDNKSIDYASKYRASIYFRAVLPFIATIFIAIGFYIETLFGFAIGSFKLASVSLWELAAGVGFLLHAGVNLYTFYLSKNSRIKQWHIGFLKNRVIAEVLRIYIHFYSFGFTLNLRTLMYKCGMDITQGSNVYGILRSILRDADNSGINEKNQQACLSYMKGLIDDQLLYHKKSVKRYQKIVESLVRYGIIFFYIGFTFVLLRGCLQFFIFTINTDFTLHGIALKSFIRSFANFLALFLPAWASYFTSKLSLCEFDFMKENDQNMIIKLEKCREILTETENHNVSNDVFQAVTEQIAVLMLSEVNDWQSELAKKSITKM